LLGHPFYHIKRILTHILSPIRYATLDDALIHMGAPPTLHDVCIH